MDLKKAVKPPKIHRSIAQEDKNKKALKGLR